jgi:1-phosphofructokinase family hexose kinase
MILCVTLNPCLDKTLTVPAWRPGDSVRGRAVRAVVGGKGNNVARALERLGREARPLLFLGGAVGGDCRALLEIEDRLKPVVITTAAATRVIVTLRTDDTADQTAFFDPDPEVTPAEAEALHRTVDTVLATETMVEAMTLSGSSPAAATHGLYSDLIALARARRVPVFLDTYGPGLDAVWGFWPDAIQLNRREAAGYLRSAPEALTEDQLFALLDRFARHGVRSAIATAGPGAVLAVLDGKRHRIVPPPLEVVNPVGSGDCLLAGTVDGWLAGLDCEARLRHAIGCARANALVWDAGAIDPEEVRRQEEVIALAPPIPEAAALRSRWP